MDYHKHIPLDKLAGKTIYNEIKKSEISHGKCKSVLVIRIL